MDSTTSNSHLRSHRLLRWSIIIIFVLILLGLLLFFAPRYLARYMLSSQLDALGIDYAGVETLNINPFTRELWLGPVRIGSSHTDAARLDSLGLTLGYNSLLHHRIYIERLIVSGIDLVVARDKEKRFILNGIPLDRLLPPPSAEPQPAAEGEPWQPGINALELRESRLLFQDQARGELAVDVERLSLSKFLAWKPENPGRFELVGRINDIQLNWSGEARPFADNITLSIDALTEQADLSKVVRYTGPLGLDRRDGVYDARLKHRLTLFHEGGLEGHTQGVIEIKAADYQRKDVFALALQRAKTDLDVQYTLKDKGDFSLTGKLNLDLGPGQVKVADETQVAVASGRIALSNLVTAYGENGHLSIELRPEVDLEQVAFSGPIEVSVDQLLNLLELLQSLSAGVEVTSADTGLGDFAGGLVAVPSSDIKVARLHSQGESLSLTSAEGKLDFALKAHTDLSGIQIDFADGQINAERLQSDLESLSLISGQGQLMLDIVGSGSLASGASKGSIGELKVGSIDSKLSRFALQVESGAIAMQAAGESAISGFSGLVYAKESRPEVELNLDAVHSTAKQASLEIKGETVRWQAAADAVADALAIQFAKGKASEMKFQRAEVQSFQADERLQLAANAISVDGLDLYLKRSLLETLFKGDESKAEQDDAQAESDKIDAVRSAAESNDLMRVQTLLGELGYDPGSVDGRMGQKTAAAIKAFQEREGIEVDGRMSAGLLAQLELRAAGAELGAEGGAPGLRVVQMALSGNPVIRFHDDIVEPPVKIDTVFKEFQVQNLNTQAQAQPTDLRVVALINEFTNLEVSGWTKGLGLAADLDVTAQVKNLELATYSPYVVELAGVYLNSGQLDTQVTGKATRGLLQGQIQLDLDHMEFKPLSEEDAARMADKVGVPLEMAVSLLEDGDGHIALKLPVSGTLSKPDVDISSAVSKAIGGVLKRVFPPTLAASLLSKIAKGGGPSFEPIAFAPGSAELDESGKRYADEVARFLKEHPKLSLKLCGRATAEDMALLSVPAEGKGPSPADLEAKAAAEQQTETAPAEGDESKIEQPQPPDPAQVEETLKQLALERKSVVRAYLIKDKQIPADRVPECRSTFTADDQGGPRVEILF